WWRCSRRTSAAGVRGNPCGTWWTNNWVTFPRGADASAREERHGEHSVPVDGQRTRGRVLDGGAVPGRGDPSRVGGDREARHRVARLHPGRSGGGAGRRARLRGALA